MFDAASKLLNYKLHYNCESRTDVYSLGETSLSFDGVMSLLLFQRLTVCYWCLGEFRKFKRVSKGRLKIAEFA